jgi:hypothetical protein
MSLGRIFEVAGEVLQGVGDAAIVNNWLGMDDDGAFRSIQAQVASSSITDIDRLDGALLALASTHLDRDVRRRLVKFYAIFKIVETLRFQEFRGFPG